MFAFTKYSLFFFFIISNLYFIILIKSVIIEELIMRLIFFIVESSIGFRIESIAFSFRQYQRECLRKSLPYLRPESSPETTRPPPQLTPGWSLTCLGLPGFAFSPSLLLFLVFPFFAFRSEIPAQNRHHGNDQGSLYCCDRSVV